MSGTTVQPTKAITKRIITGTCHAENISGEEANRRGGGEQKLAEFILFILSPGCMAPTLFE